MTLELTGILTPRHPERLQLYTLPTPNGKKASIALEELGLAYEAHRIDIGKGDQHLPEFVQVNPNSKIPALVDPDGPGGEPLAIMESGAILLYLADKAGGELIPEGRAGYSRMLQWMFFQVGSVGPMFGQFGHFYHYAKGRTDTYGEQRYGKEVTRLLGVLDRHLAQHEWVVDTYSLADIMLVPWILGLEFYQGKEFVGYDQFENVHRWVAAFEARPAVQRGSVIGSAEWAEAQAD